MIAPLTLQINVVFLKFNKVVDKGKERSNIITVFIE